MPKGLKRHYGDGHLHFITCSCDGRLPLLGRAEARDRFVQILGEVRARYGFAIFGYVVMPEHVHMLISEPAGGTPSTVMQVLKQRVSLQLRDEPARVGAFWQRRFHDFNVFTEKKKNEKLEYMHMNPVKRNLVEWPEDWPWSSCNFYQGKGIVLLGLDISS